MVVLVITVSTLCFLYQLKKLKNIKNNKKPMIINTALLLITIGLTLYISSPASISITKILDYMANALFPKAFKNFMFPLP